MSPPRKTAEPPEETEAPEEPKSSLSDDDKGWIRQEIRDALGEILAPGPEEVGIPEKKLEEPEEPTTTRQIEAAAEKVVRAAQAMLKPPEKEKDDDTPEPERPPAPANKLRDWLWGKE